MERSFIEKKSFRMTDPVSEYVRDFSWRLHPVQKKLMELTLPRPESIMLAGDPEVHQLMQNLIRSIKAKNVLDIGVYTGASSLAMALALPEDGKVLGCDVNDEYVNLGRPFWKEANVDHKIEIKIAPALETLDQLIASGQSGQFDFAFLDADKPNYYNYYQRLKKLIRSGGIIAVDNVIWSGKVADPSVQDPSTVAIRDFNEKIFKDSEVHMSMLKIGDGLTLIFMP